MATLDEEASAGGFLSDLGALGTAVGNFLGGTGGLVAGNIVGWGAEHARRALTDERDDSQGIV